MAPHKLRLKSMTGLDEVTLTSCPKPYMYHRLNSLKRGTIRNYIGQGH